MKYPSFVDDQAYIDMDATMPEVDQLRAMLNNLTRIHLLTANKFDSFDDLIREYLIAGIDVFGLETGIVSEIDEDGRYHVCDVVSPLEELEKGQVFELNDTYCREVVRSHQVLGFPEVGALAFMNCHPVYLNLKLEAYLSAPIFVGEKLFGTLNFTSIKPRVRGFSIQEHNLIKLMANSIGAFILLRNNNDKLVALNDRMKRLVGYVSHDLRNPLGSIISLSKLAMREGLSKERLQDIVRALVDPAEKALELVSSILEYAALGTGKITLDKQVVCAQTMLEEAVNSVSHFILDSNVAVKYSCDASLKVECDANRMHQTLTNLLINAVKYSPENSYILLSAEEENGGCEIKITNNVVKNGENESLESQSVYGSVGFGLDIVNEVLNAHGVTMTKHQTPTHFTIAFNFPLA
ncbi:GAF domain-containing sensor histidine kinase [Alkalimarinus alittae]|uniref:histidine kinase n=1 Tax=Alkalimarinus alittae TaxID=2961619 RepID=A0ABY6N3Y1_9ALTE|nr:HAMP domain-containing sensor histidine kinase [Alkalimarinus alittae]UZE96798.1 HAMP domain-containing histidine kinase [Alkalimarinus alittae]